MSIGLDTPKGLIECSHKGSHMYKMPSEKLVQRMHTLVSHLMLTDPESHEGTFLLSMEASRIIAELEKEYEKPVDKFAAFNQFDLQVILYSKEWYKQNEVLLDLKTIISKIANFDIKYIKDIDVIQQVAHTLHKIWSASNGPTNWDMQILYKDTWEGPLWQKKESITLKDHVDSLLRVIRFKNIEYFPELPTPSAEYLPLSHDDSLERWAKLKEPLTSTKV